MWHFAPSRTVDKTKTKTKTKGNWAHIYIATQKGLTLCALKNCKKKQNKKQN